MKKGYIRLLVFEIIVFLVFILNSFISNILGEYNIVVFLSLLLILFKFAFGFEKDRPEYTKDVIFEIMIFLVIFFVLFYLSGLVIGFAQTNYLNWYGLKTFVFPLLFSIILREILRYMMLKKSEGSSLLLVTTIIMFVFLDITDAIYYNEFNTGYNSFIFFALSLLPAISNNVVCTLISKRCGYKPVIVYMLVIKLYSYLLPLVPNPNEYILSIINFMLPIFLYYKVQGYFEKREDKEIERNYKKGKISALILPAVLAVIVIYFTSGYFKYQAVAIASGSMSPKIEKGDIVVIEKLEANETDKLKVGDVIAFEHRGVVVVHRLIDIKKIKGESYFYTKGDANDNEDNYSISRDEIVGKIELRIPFVGLPTVWLNEM